MTQTLEELLKVPTASEKQTSQESSSPTIIEEKKITVSEEEPDPIIIQNEEQLDEDSVNSEIETSPEDTEDEIPEYMYHDAGMVGYGDDQIQQDIYNLTMRGTVPLVGKLSILDIGAGRGDILHHIKNRLPELEIDYRGYEVNSLLAKIGIEKYKSATFGKFSANIEVEDFMTAEIINRYDLTLMVGTLNLDYGFNMQPWEYLELMLRKALDVTEMGGTVVMVLLQDNGGEDQYISYPIPNMTDLIMKFNMPFTIEYGEIPSVYKLSIKKQPIYITQ
jgi:hypothetical protein